MGKLEKVRSSMRKIRRSIRSTNSIRKFNQSNVGDSLIEVREIADKYLQEINEWFDKISMIDPRAGRYLSVQKELGDTQQQKKILEGKIHRKEFKIKKVLDSKLGDIKRLEREIESLESEYDEILQETPDEILNACYIIEGMHEIIEKFNTDVALRKGKTSEVLIISPKANKVDINKSSLAGIAVGLKQDKAKIKALKSTLAKQGEELYVSKEQRELMKQHIENMSDPIEIFKQDMMNARKEFIDHMSEAMINYGFNDTEIDLACNEILGGLTDEKIDTDNELKEGEDIDFSSGESEETKSFFDDSVGNEENESHGKDNESDSDYSRRLKR